MTIVPLDNAGIAGCPAIALPPLSVEAGTSATASWAVKYTEDVIVDPNRLPLVELPVATI